METADYIVIGGGMAGVSVAAELSASASVIVLEAEERIGVHATGRSAALFSEMYGNRVVRALTRASREMLFAPPAGFAEVPLVRPRAVMFVAGSGQVEHLHTFAALPDVRPHVDDLDLAEALRLFPPLRPEWLAAALLERASSDIDVDALHNGYFRWFKRNGGELRTERRIDALSYEAGFWTIRAGEHVHRTPIVINAAGAWADEIAALAGAAKIGLQPYRRTAVLVEPPPGAVVTDWPMVIDIDEQFYIKPDAGLLLLSPADETAVEPGDAQPEEWDIAVAVDRVGTVADIPVRSIRRSWAGLRSFVADRTPVIGFAATPGFFWLAGQGGYGIQSAPAMARMAAALVRGLPVPADIVAQGIGEADLSPHRFPGKD
ncbi:NAD(P)/FAD-dependent oxidoreductase [Glacieibacterium sp.]|uniref:NAD(P)/FAD-dependent oxidoreductase n=1 Tax=Glacieibacterium sp. TaxID=2860237 RepID=UPI003AFFCE63